MEVIVTGPWCPPTTGSKQADLHSEMPGLTTPQGGISKALSGIGFYTGDGKQANPPALWAKALQAIGRGISPGQEPSGPDRLQWAKKGGSGYTEEWRHWPPTAREVSPIWLITCAPGPRCDRLAPASSQSKSTMSKQSAPGKSPGRRIASVLYKQSSSMKTQCPLWISSYCRWGADRADPCCANQQETEGDHHSVVARMPPDLL